MTQFEVKTRQQIVDETLATERDDVKWCRAWMRWMFSARGELRDDQNLSSIQSTEYHEWQANYDDDSAECPYCGQVVKRPKIA